MRTTELVHSQRPHVLHQSGSGKLTYDLLQPTQPARWVLADLCVWKRTLRHGETAPPLLCIRACAENLVEIL